MRITSTMMQKGYMRNLNRAAVTYNKSMVTATNYRKFQTVSEDPGAATKAFQLRRELVKKEAYLENAENIEGKMDVAEGILKTYHEKLKDINDRLVAANTGTIAADDREVFAKELETVAAAILQDMNGEYAGQYVFGGAETSVPPFSTDAKTGEMLYRGYPLAFDEKRVGEEGYPYISKEDFDKKMEEFTTDSVLIDLGYGLIVNDGRSAFEASLPGINYLGYGTDEETGLNKNTYNLIREMAAYLRNDDANFDHDKFGNMMNQFGESIALYLVGITEMGTKTSALEYTTNRLETAIVDLKEKSSEVEHVDFEEAVTDFKWDKTAWNAALQIGTQVIQPSLLNYLK